MNNDEIIALLAKLRIGVADLAKTIEDARSLLADEKSNTPATRHFSQVDRRWSEHLLGSHPQYTIRNWGCALCCAAMLVSTVDPSVNPLELQESLLPVGGFWRANINWAAIPILYPELKFLGIANWVNRPLDATELHSVKEHIKKLPTILWVDYKPETPTQETHFVLAIGLSEDEDDILVLDPATLQSDAVSLLDTYGDKRRGDNALSRWIYGMRPFSRLESPPTETSFSTLAASCLDDWPEPIP